MDTPDPELVSIIHDALRYRALRDRPRQPNGRMHGVHVVDYESRSEGTILYGNDLDAALDRLRHTKPPANPTVTCACGCGATFDRFDTKGRARKYVPGHNPTTRAAHG